jgi:single-strand DNA-binding protein
MGRLTKDPELQYTSNNNTAVCKFTLAVNRRFKKDGQPEADFINIVTWSKTAEFAAKYFVKGLQVAAVGSLQNRSWDDNEGKKHYITEVIADEVYFAESRRNDSADRPVKNVGGSPSLDGTDDDLPF